MHVHIGRYYLLFQASTGGLGPWPPHKQDGCIHIYWPGCVTVPCLLSLTSSLALPLVFIPPSTSRSYPCFLCTASSPQNALFFPSLKHTKPSLWHPFIFVIVPWLRQANPFSHLSCELPSSHDPQMPLLPTVTQIFFLTANHRLWHKLMLFNTPSSLLSTSPTLNATLSPGLR